MSNLSSHRPAPYKAQTLIPSENDWEEEGLFRSPGRDHTYGATDWSKVPKVDYASVGFTQLSIPEAAEVVEDDSEFMLDDLDSLKQMGERHQETLAGDANKRVARALTLELEKPNYRVKDLNKSELLSRAKLGNPEAKSNEEQPFIPTYGESRRALLKKLGFSDDYELSLSGSNRSNSTRGAPAKEALTQGTTTITTTTEDSALDDPSSKVRGQERAPDALLTPTSRPIPKPMRFQNEVDADDADDADYIRAGNSQARDFTGHETDQTQQGRSNLASGLGTEEDRYLDVDEKIGDSNSATHLAPLQVPAQTALDISQSEMQEAISKAYEEGFTKGATEAKEKALVQESLKAEMSLKELEKKDAEHADKEQAALKEREQLRKEYEQEILLLKEKIQSFDESLLGELEKKKEQLDLEMQPRIKVLTDLCDQLKALTQDSQTFFEPLKRLSVHIAEQLVLGELSISTHTVQRLIHRCVDELNMRDNPVVRVELNALDKSMLESVLNLPNNQDLNALVLNSSQTMQVGSVRVLMNDTQIEDLIQNRLETIAARLLGQPQKWRDESVLLKTPVQGNYISPKQEDVKEDIKEDIKKEPERALESDSAKSPAQPMDAAAPGGGVSANLGLNLETNIQETTNSDEQQVLPQSAEYIQKPNAQSLSSSSSPTEVEGVRVGLNGDAFSDLADLADLANVENVADHPTNTSSISGEESNDA